MKTIFNQKQIHLRLFAVITVAAMLLTLFTGCMTINTYTGVQSAAWNENGELILTYEDGHTQNLGRLDGKAAGESATPTEALKNDPTPTPTGETKKDTVITKPVSELFPDSSATADTSAVTDVAQAASKGLRSAVSVICTYTVSGSSYYNPFYPSNGSGSGTQQAQSAGSGVIYKLNKETGDALIITNYHVVYSSSSVTANGISDTIDVYLYGSEMNGKGIPATYVGGSMYYDIAVLYVSGSELLKNSCAQAVTVANSDGVNVGDAAMAIGNPEGDGTSVTYGVVSVDSEYIEMTGADDRTTVSFRVMRVDTAVNSGNSGGGLYNAQGNLIGIVNAKESSSTVENIGYAIPSNVVRAIADNIIDYCFGKECESVQRGLLGITVQITDSQAYVDETTGLVKIREQITVAGVNEGGLADGIVQVGDVLTAITLHGKTQTLTRQYQLIDAMLEVRVGDTVTIELIRDGITLQKTATITEACLAAY